MHKNILAFLLLLTFSLHAESQEWCSGARSEVERTICGNTDLGGKDRRLSELFAKTRDAASDRSRIISQQRQFLKRRNACGSDTACLMAEYDRQISSYIVLVGEPSPQLTLEQEGRTPTSPEPPPAGETATAGQVIEITNVSINFGKLGSAGNAMDSLIVANSNYVELDTLETPDADASLVSAALKARGISVRTEKNLTRSSLVSALKEFSNSHRKDVFIFYYAGHAANISGNSSIILPTFAIADGRTNGEYIQISDITQIIADLGYKKTLIVFDACRNILDVDDGQVGPRIAAEYANTRSVKPLQSRALELASLADMDYAISFSSAEGQTALDTVNGQNSPFAEAFATNIRDKETFFDAIIETRRAVRTLTNDRQRPTLEMSWDEDLALSSNLVHYLEYSFLDPISVKVGKSSKDIQKRPTEYSLRVWEIESPGGDTSACKLSIPANGGAMFLTYMFDCLEKDYGLTRGDGKNYGIIYTPAEPLETDSHLTLCSSASWRIDLDLDGRAETATFSHNRYGGYLEFKRDGHTATYYSRLGCNFTGIMFYDIDRNGVADIILSYQCAKEYECLAILSGERLVANVDGDFQHSDERSLERYFQKSQWMGILDGLRSITLYYDEKFKGFGQLSAAGLDYQGWSNTWEIGRSDRMPNKHVRIARNGTVELLSDGDRYEFESFENDSLMATKIGKHK